MKRVADILVEALVELGVKDCFCVVGGGAMHLNNAFKINKDMHVTYCHHEQACAFAAEGYAKYSGKVAAVSVTSGPGVVNTLNGIYSAYVDNTPMIVISGHPRYDTTVEACGLNLRVRGVQEFNIIPSVQNMTKYAKMINDPLRIKEEVDRAYDIAMEGRRGPVLLSIPLDIQAKQVDELRLFSYEKQQKETADISSVINNVVNMLNEAKRPCILAGSAIRSADAHNEFLKLVSKLDIPVIGESCERDILPRGYKNFYGNSGSTGPRAGNYILQEADLILILGNSMSTRQTGFNVEGFAPKAKLIMVDIEKDEPFKPGLHIDYPVQCDIKSFMISLTNAINDRILCPQNWKEYCEEIYNFFVNYDLPEVPEDGTVPEKLFWDMFLDKIDSDAIVSLGNSNCVVGVLQLGIRKDGQRIITNVNAGSMGYDLPMATGVAVSAKRQVYCITGDGSIMMNLQELETIKYNKLPVKIVVFNNHGYGAIRQTCRNYFNGEYAGCDPESGVDFPPFEKIAYAFEYDYMRCEKYAELDDKLDAFIQKGSQAILEIIEDIDDTVMPKIMSKMRPDGTFETPSFTDLSPFISDKDEQIIEELRSLLY